MKKICIYLLLLVSHSSFGQVNLVQNSSFEDTAFCVNGPYVNVETPPWFNPTISTPDYYSSYPYCGYNWNNAYDYQQPHSGNCMIGLFCFEQNGEREYLETPLGYPLIGGRQYFVKFYCAAAAYSHYLIDKIGVYFSPDTVTSANYPYGINVTPQIHSQPGLVLNDSINWTEISGLFTAVGGEKYLTVGEFYLNSQLTVDSSGSANVAVGYYYIDDVTVLDYDSLIAGTPLISPNSFDIELRGNEMLINYTAFITVPIEITIYDMIGRVILYEENKIKNGISTYRIKDNLQNGIYIVQLKTKSFVKTIKVKQF
jgi:hypothetical protein